MAASNQLMQAQQMSFSSVIATNKYQQAIANSIPDSKQANRFIAAITSAVATTPALQACRPDTILTGALLGESLGLSPSPQLGQYYLVPFKSKAKVDTRTGELIEPECTKATFVLGYKGYIQLALRSGYYKKLNVLPIKEGEFKGFNPLDEEISVQLIVDDWDKREQAPTVGYYVMFEYLNGFRKADYWSKGKMLAHADRYSKAFSKDAYAKIQRGEIKDSDMWKYSSFWYTDFDGMACKTMLRQIISKWGMMSMDLQTAFERDESLNEMNSQGDVISTPVYDATAPELPIVEESVPQIAEPVPQAQSGKVNLDEL